jgi:hypothetical protein
MLRLRPPLNNQTLSPPEELLVLISRFTNRTVSYRDIDLTERTRINVVPVSKR